MNGLFSASFVVLVALALQSPSLADAVVSSPVAVVRDLVARGVDVNEKDEEGVTPLMRAASAGRGEVVSVLVASGAEVDAKTNGGVTPLMMAALGGYADAVAPLLAKANPNAKDNQGRTALMAAATSGNAAVVDALIAAGAEIAAADAAGSTALTYASAEGKAAVIVALQRRGARPGDNDMLLAAGQCNTDIVRSYLGAGMKPTIERGGTTLLHAAAGNNCADTVQLLIERGAQTNVKDGDGWTPLIKAAQGGFIEVVRVLLAHDADISIADGNGRTAWTYAAMGNHTEIAELFRARRTEQEGSTRLIVESPTLQSDRPIPRQYTADGRNISPPLTWTNAPGTTKSFAVVCEDPDAGNPPPFVHWVIYNIPPTASGLPENIPFEPNVPMPADVSGAVQGISGFRRPIYRGPAPPPGKVHHYRFVVYALDRSDLAPGLNRTELLDAIKGHVLARGELVATYERTP